MDQLPEELRQDLSEAQVSGVVKALQKVGWQKKHAVNIRLSIPLFFTRVFVTVLAGSEQREPDRRAGEKESHPLRTFGNILFVGTVALTIYAFALAGILAYSSILEF